MTKHSRTPHPDLEVLLGRVSPEEAARLHEVWMLVGDEDPVESPRPEDVEAAVRRLSHTLGAAAPPPPQPSPPVHRRRDRDALRRSPRVRRAWAAAAAVLLLGALGGIAWLRPVDRIAAPGERLTLTLSDGSRVELNSGSRLRYARRFGDARTVALEGEAFFDVAHAPRPFVVETFNARIQVLGTRFGVRAWSGGPEPGTTVALETGRVALAPAAQPHRAVTMTPGETRRVGLDDGAGLPLPHVSVEEATAWRRGDLIFKDEPLGVILADVGRRFAVDIRFPVTLQQERMTLTLRQPADAEAVVRDLAGALGLRYRATSNGFELYLDDGR